MDRLAIFMAAGFYLVVCGVAFGAAKVLVASLSEPWRQASGAHWAERARLAFAPGHATICLMVVLPPLLALTGLVVAEVLGLETSILKFWAVWLVALAGIMAERYRWLRELWGPRVTLRAWLAGYLVLLLLLAPHFLVLWLLFLFLPDTPETRSLWIFVAGVLAMGLFAAGAGLWLLRLAGVVRAAPRAVTEMVEQLGMQMKVPRPVKVFEIEWVQVNALALLPHGAVGFSRALLEVMAPDEVRAVAAHELAHLVEPKWARVVRIAHMFSYLGLAPLVKYGGSFGLLACWLIVIAIVTGYKRFSRRMEIRADRLEHEAIAESGPYMQSLIKLHEANLAPAVMPGSQTHPHLYDRLLAGGIQPDFPRPTAPSRAKPLLAAAAAGIVGLLMVLIMGLAAGVALRLADQGLVRHLAPATNLPGRLKTQEETPTPDFSDAARDPEFQRAITEASQLFAVAPQPLKSQAEDKMVPGGVSFEVPHQQLESMLAGAHTDFAARGCYLFRCENQFGFEGFRDRVGLLPTRDKYLVIAAMGTNGDNYEIGTGDVIAWIRELEQEQPFILTGIGFDFIEGFFTSPVKQPRELAKRMYPFCPDIVTQGAGSVSALAEQLAKGRLYFWWD